MKGQSAIEYLATYGWMILAVAAMSGLAYNHIQASCTSSSADFYSDAAEINQFGITGSGDFVVSIENTGYQEITIKGVNITINKETREYTKSVTISSGKTKQLNFKDLKSSKSCSTMDLVFTLERASLQSQQVKGIVRAPIDFEN